MFGPFFVKHITKDLFSVYICVRDAPRIPCLDPFKKYVTKGPL